MSGRLHRMLLGAPERGLRSWRAGQPTGPTGACAVEKVSVVIPAHDEAHVIGRLLASIDGAASRAAGGAEVEVVVVANRCTDATVEVAEAAGARTVEDGSRNIAAVRNAGVRASTGSILVTIDADSTMHPAALESVVRLLGSGRYVGGGTQVHPERWSPGIAATYALLEVVLLASGLSGGMFWCRRHDFDAVGGFDERLLVGEDLDFARRLRTHGRRTGRRFVMLTSAPMTASCRKFDRFGDWHMFAMAGQLPSIVRSAKGTDTTWVDRYFFDFEG